MHQVRMGFRSAAAAQLSNAKRTSNAQCPASCTTRSAPWRSPDCPHHAVSKLTWRPQGLSTQVLCAACCAAVQAAPHTACMPGILGQLTSSAVGHTWATPAALHPRQSTLSVMMIAWQCIPLHVFSMHTVWHALNVSCLTNPAVLAPFIAGVAGAASQTLSPACLLS